MLPCFNAGRFLAGALDSLLGQTYAHLEVVAVDDGSTDETPDILDRYANRDDRVRVLHNDGNRGLIHTLNVGVAEARGDLIARMDADDIADPARIERQVDALTTRPEIGVLGTGVQLVSETGQGRVRPRPVRCREPAGARFMALLATPVAHPTLMARTEVMRAHPYGGSAESLHTEDYELFTRMLLAGIGFANIDEPLVTVRVRQRGVSLTNEDVQIANFVACARRYLKQTLDLEPQEAAHRVLVNRIDKTIGGWALREGLRLLGRVQAAFAQRELQATHEVTRVVDMQRVDILVQAALKGSAPARLVASTLAVRYASRLVSPAARGYLASKL